MAGLIPKLELLWLDPPAKWKLTAPDIHIWASNLYEATAHISTFERLLSPEELDRASRFYFERDRRRFIAGRGILREILSSYLEMSPSQLHFSYGLHGKPYLGEGEGSAPLQFNVTHSEDLIVIAVTNACSLGIDVERVRPIPEFEYIAGNFFSTRETAELTALPNEQQQRAFYQIWTRKEACLKAIGGGLSDLTRQMEVTFQPGYPAEIRAIPDTQKIAAAWTLVELRPAPEYVATLAAPATGLNLSRWQWPLCSVRQNAKRVMTFQI
jgi:4'-phosphopantetheinyl transferase